MEDYSLQLLSDDQALQQAMHGMLNNNVSSDPGSADNYGWPYSMTASTSGSNPQGSSGANKSLQPIFNQLQQSITNAIQGGTTASSSSSTVRREFTGGSSPVQTTSIPSQQRGAPMQRQRGPAPAPRRTYMGPQGGAPAPRSSAPTSSGGHNYITAGGTGISNTGGRTANVGIGGAAVPIVNMGGYGGGFSSMGGYGGGGFGSVGSAAGSAFGGMAPSFGGGGGFANDLAMGD